MTRMELQQKTLIETENSRFYVVDNFCEDYYEYLRSLPLIHEPPIKVAGKMCHQRRDINFFSDVSEGYKYSGQIAKSVPLKDQPILVEILNKVNDYLGTTFNGILVNRYENGEKYIGKHSDNEDGLDKCDVTNSKFSKGGIVAGIAFGPSTRKLRFRNIKTNKIVLDYDNNQLDLYVMEGKFQLEFTHEIPKQLKIKGERISLTFRTHTK